MFMLCEGFFQLSSNLPKYWIWGYYMGFHTYTFEMFMWTEFDGAIFTCDSPIPGSALCAYSTGEQVLAQYSMDNVKVQNDLGILIAMAVIYRLLFWAVLQRFHTGKK